MWSVFLTWLKSDVSIVDGVLLIAAVASFAAVCGGLGWTANGWRLERQIAELKTAHAEQLVRQAAAAADQLATARANEQAMTKAYEEATQNARKREQALAADVAALNATALGLRHDLDSARARLSTAPLETCRRAADAAYELFGTCATTYRSLAETTDRILNERDLCLAAWPETP